MKKGIKIGVITLLLLLTGCTIGGSFFMLNYSLRPEAKIRAKNADSYPFMYKNYPFLRPWVDSLNQAHALRDTFVLNPEGIRLHAYYIAAPQPTKKTAVIVHGYTDNAIRMFMIGYLYNMICNTMYYCPTSNIRGRVVVPPSRWAGKTAWT